MEKSEVKLVGAFPSPYVNRIQIGLNLKSVKYEFVEENLLSKSELLLKSNPVYKKIPVLVHDGKPICESLIILQYIDDTWTYGPSLLPADPYDCAIARFWAAYLDDKWFPLVRAVQKAQGEEAKAAAIEGVIGGLVFIEETFVKCSKGKTFFGGDSIGYLDIALGSFLGWLRVAEKVGCVALLDETKTPSLMKWANRFLSDDAVKGIIPNAEKLIEAVKMFEDMVKARSSN